MELLLFPGHAAHWHRRDDALPSSGTRWYPTERVKYPYNSLR